MAVEGLTLKAEMVVQNYVPTSHDPIRLGGIDESGRRISAKQNIEIRVTYWDICKEEEHQFLLPGFSHPLWGSSGKSFYGWSIRKDGQLEALDHNRSWRMHKEIRKIDPNSDLCMLPGQ